MKAAQQNNDSALTTTQSTEITVINQEYLQPMAMSRAGYPSLQASQYRNLSIKPPTSLSLGFSQAAADLLGADALAAMAVELISVDFGEKEEMLFVPSAEIKWVPLAFPSKWIIDTTDKEKPVYREIGGEWNANCKSVCKLFLVAVKGDAIIKNDEGHPAICCLNFKGLRTNRITGNSASLRSLNAALCKHYNVTTPSYMAHLASISITAVPMEYKSASDAKLSSIGVDFALANATLLSPALQAEVVHLLRTDDVLAQNIRDPFGVAATEAELLF